MVDGRGLVVAGRRRLFLDHRPCFIDHLLFDQGPPAYFQGAWEVKPCPSPPELDPRMLEAPTGGGLLEDRGGMKTFIVTVTAADQVGIVYSVTGTIGDHEGNILELSQTVMRGYFTIILAVELPDSLDPELIRRAIAEKGRRFELSVDLREARPASPPVPAGERFLITVIGSDHPGNIHGIAGCLAEHGVNIVDLHARADGPIFSLVMETYLPPDLPPSTIREELERFGRELGLEAYVQHENIFLATSEPRPVRVGPARYPEGSTVIVPH